MQTIITIASVITAIITIISAIVTIYKLVRSVEKKIDRFENNLNDNTLSTLRLVIINEKMPLSERLNARCKVYRVRRKWRNPCTI